MKIDLSDEFYRIELSDDDIAKLGVVFSTLSGKDPLASLPLLLPIRWENSSPIFITATETIADLANHVLAQTIPLPVYHPLSILASLQDVTPASVTVPSDASHPSHDPSLPFLCKLQSSIDVFLDNFIGIAQERRYRHYVPYFDFYHRQTSRLVESRSQLKSF